jgi:hypothetical protein
VRGSARLSERARLNGPFPFGTCAALPLLGQRRLSLVTVGPDSPPKLWLLPLLVLNLIRERLQQPKVQYVRRHRKLHTHRNKKLPTYLHHRPSNLNTLRFVFFGFVQATSGVSLPCVDCAHHGEAGRSPRNHTILPRTLGWRTLQTVQPPAPQLPLQDSRRDSSFRTRR